MRNTEGLDLSEIYELRRKLIETTLYLTFSVSNKNIHQWSIGWNDTAKANA